VSSNVHRRAYRRSRPGLAFGAGSEHGSQQGREGDGGGGGGDGAVAPTGHIELKDSHGRFVPIVHPARMVALVLAAVIEAFLIMRPTPVEPCARKRRWR
jgi:uncharacterized spore protein YtfJ